MRDSILSWAIQRRTCTCSRRTTSSCAGSRTRSKPAGRGRRKRRRRPDSAKLARSSRCSMHTTNIDLAALAVQSRERPVRLRVGQLIDGNSDHAIRDADVVFDATQIHSVGKADGAADAVLPDHTLLPCLIEAHAHMFLDGAPVDFQQREQYLKESPQWMLERARKRWHKILQCGVGAIRDAGDKHGVGVALAAEAKTRSGQLSPTPWIDSPAAAIHHRGRYGSFMGEAIEDHASLAARVADRVHKSADRIKLLVSGIINFKTGQVTTPPQMSV